jgi:hypothetical protein
MTKNIKITILSLIVFVLQPAIIAQTKIEVVTRTILKTFKYNPSCILIINAEKAKIQIKKSTNNAINLKISLVSKNPSIDLAESDLKYCYYQIDENNNSISISNFFNIKIGDKKNTSNLSARMEIEIPVGITLKLKDIYGEVEMNGTNGIFDLVVDYGKVKFTDVSGRLTLKSNCTDIKCSNIKACLNIMAQKADMIISNTSDELKIKNQFGNLELENPQATVTVEAKMTEIKVVVNDFKNYSFDAYSDGSIDVPKEYDRYLLHYKNSIFFNDVDAGAHFITLGKIPINVKTTYNNIILKTK